MPRKVFFSFDYDKDIWRVSQVRNSQKIKDWEEVGFIDAASWEEVKRKGDDAIKAWIRGQLDGTSVTIVLIGNQTSNSRWVRFELEESYKRGNGLLGIKIHTLKNQEEKSDFPGENPFAKLHDNGGHLLSDVFKTYDWELDGGFQNVGKWIERAAQNPLFCERCGRKI